jgi:hypothetical protein
MKVIIEGIPASADAASSGSKMVSRFCERSGSHLGNFGKPTEEFGTVEQANEDDAIVKWDNDGRTRQHQPWLKKV